MKKIALLFFLFTLSLVALDKGKSYDFQQKNGQNVINAQLVAEDEKSYTIKLPYLAKPIQILKTNLVGEPMPSVQQAQSTFFQSLKPRFALYAGFGVAYPTLGGVAYIFQRGWDARVGVDWLPFATTFWGIRALSFYTAYSFYPSMPRRIQLASAYLGPKFLVRRWKNIDAALTVSFLAGTSYARLKGYTFTAEDASFSTLALVGFEKRWGRTAVGLQLYVNYLFDESVTFVTTGLSISAHYPLGSAELF
ncbi:MAG TPA: hypothetical protein PLY93_03790 [Turneriella sp.]|nr:hypothetical protein [Turneriella sp.]